MDRYILGGDPPVEVALRVSARARRYSLRVSRLDGRVTLTMPRTASRARGIAFVEQKSGWIRQKLSERPDIVTVGLGAVVPVGGEPAIVCLGEKSRLRLEAARIEISPRARSVPGTVAGLLKTRARERIGAATARFTTALGRPHTRLTLRDTRSRWGSCSADGALMLSWRLIMAPPDVLDYVVAHEVAHLAQMNHSPRFWATVERLYPGHARQRLWLRRHGEELHRFRFED